MNEINAKSMVVPATFLRSCFKITGEFPSASEKVAGKAGKPAPYSMYRGCAPLATLGWV